MSTRTATLFPYTTLFRSGYAPINSIVPPAVQRNPEVMGFPVSQGREQSSRLPPLPCVRTQLAERLLARATCAQKAATKVRSEEHTSELQSLMRISYAVLCLKKPQARTRLHKPSISTTLDIVNEKVFTI